MTYNPSWSSLIVTRTIKRWERFKIIEVVDGVVLGWVVFEHAERFSCLWLRFYELVNNGLGFDLALSVGNGFCLLFLGKCRWREEQP